MSGEERSNGKGLSFEQIAANTELVLVGSWQEQLRKATKGPVPRNAATAVKYTAGLLTDDQQGGSVQPGESIESVALFESERLRHEPSRSRIWLAAAVLLTAALGVTALLRGEGEKQEVAATVDQPSAVVGRFIDGFTAGETAEVIALFAPGAPIRYQDTSGTANMLTSDSWESLVAFYAAQSAVITGEECGDLGNGTIRCEWQLEDAVTRAAGQPGDDVLAEFVIVDQQITSLDYTIDFFSEARSSFFNWVTANRPEVDEVFAWGPDSTPAEGQVFGELVARYAAQWANATAITPNADGE